LDDLQASWVRNQIPQTVNITVENGEVILPYVHNHEDTDPSE